MIKYVPHGEHMVKIGPVVPEICLECLFLKKDKKKINASRTLSPRAGMLCGLNKMLQKLAKVCSPTKIICNKIGEALC